MVLGSMCERKLCALVRPASQENSAMPRRAPRTNDFFGKQAEYCFESTVSEERTWGNPKQHMKLQQPRNYDFWMFQFNLLGSKAATAVK